VDISSARHIWNRSSEKEAPDKNLGAQEFQRFFSKMLGTPISRSGVALLNAPA